MTENKSHIKKLEKKLSNYETQLSDLNCRLMEKSTVHDTSKGQEVYKLYVPQIETLKDLINSQKDNLTLSRKLIHKVEEKSKSLVDCNKNLKDKLNEYSMNNTKSYANATSRNSNAVGMTNIPIIK